MAVRLGVAICICVLFLVTTITAEVIPLEVSHSRPLVSGTTRGFHPAVTVHERDFFGRWTSRFYEVHLHGGIVAVGEYYARVKIGGQTVRVQIDTGSATLAVPMAECTSCKKGDMRYDIKKSNSGQARIIGCNDDECEGNKCNSFICGKCSAKRGCCATSDHGACAFHLSFGDGSGARGILVKDMLEWGNTKFPVVFGGIRHDSPDFERKQVDGILGMAYPRLACNPSCVKPAWESARDYLKLKDMFTMCMTDDGGTITFGDFDSRVNTTEVTWVPMHLTNPPNFYNMRLVGNMKIGERELVLPSYRRAILDSGTTLIVFSRRAFKMFLDHLMTHYCHIPGLCKTPTWFKPAHCVKIEDEDRLKLPNLEFQLEGFKISLTPSEYMINYKSKGPLYWCVGLMELDTMSGGVDIIFGNTVMKKYLTIYDRANVRLGFAECGGNCDPKTTTTTETTALPIKKPPNDNTDQDTIQKPILPKEPKNAPQPHSGSQAGAQQHSQAAGTQSAVALCGTAKNCTECTKLGDKKCFWDTPLSACIPGLPTKLMCAIDSIVSHTAEVIGTIVAVCFVLILLIIVVVWRKRKRRMEELDARVDPYEQDEQLEPLAREEQLDEFSG